MSTPADHRLSSPGAALAATSSASVSSAEASSPHEAGSRATTPRPLNEGERAVIEALREIAFGEVEVTIHNARIVQITRSQKFRLQER